MSTVVREVMGGTVRNIVSRWRLLAAVGVGAWLSACSADVTRLDYPALGLSDSSTGSTSSRPQPPQPVYTQPGYQQPYYQGGYTARLPRHPSASTALTLGIVALVGGFYVASLILTAIADPRKSFSLIGRPS